MNAKTKAKKTTAPAYPVPTTRERAQELLAEIGKLQAQVDAAGARAKARNLQLALALAKKTAPLNDEIDAKFEALFMWAQANRKELLKGDSKSVDLATGRISWRFTPPRVEIARGKVGEQLQELLGDRTLEAFVRTTHEINKEAILAAYADGDEELVERLTYIDIKRTEEFVAKASDLTAEIVETVKGTK